MRILVTGGGTGGHIYPALSFIRKVQQEHPDTEFLYVGTKRGLESKIVPKAGVPFETIKIQGFKRSLSLENFKTVYLFLKSIQTSKKIIGKFKPDVVIGTGGYVCGSVVYAAHKEKIPTIIHEQNSVPGVTNKFLAKYVDKICVCFKDAIPYFPKEKVILTGNPRGEELVDTPKSNALENYGLKADIPTVVIFGGSQGALKINQAVLAAIPELSKKKYQILYVSGERYYQQVSQELAQLNVSLNNISVQPYIDNMVEILANIQLIVSRAGATTIAELTALGIPSILIPSPYVTNDHQTKNAESLVRVGAALMIPDPELTGTTLVTKIDEVLLDEQKRQTMSTAAKAEGIPDAASRLYDVVRSVVK